MTCPHCGADAAALQAEVARLRARRVVRLRVVEWSVGATMLCTVGAGSALVAALGWVRAEPVAPRLGAIAGVLLVLAVLLRLRVSVQRAGDPPRTPGWYTVTSRSGVEWVEHVFTPEERAALDIGNLPLGRPR